MIVSRRVFDGLRQYLPKAQGRRARYRPGRLSPTIEAVEPRVVLVAASLSGGLWNIVLDRPAHILLQPSVTGDGAIDVLENNELMSDLRVLAASVQHILIAGSGGSDTVDLTALNRGVFVQSVGISVFGEGGNDILNGPLGMPARFNGGDGNDTLAASFASDTLEGGTGNDVLDGASGSDILRGEAGNDTLQGGRGNDLLLGGAGRDALFGGTGDDIAQGQGGSGDVLDGGAGNDSLAGGDGNDILRGSIGDDLLDGQQGDDVLSGDAGNDLVLGADGLDSLSGSLGRDVLIGGLGLDSLSGGDDEDILVGAASTHGVATLVDLRTRWVQHDNYRLRVAALSDATNSNSLTLDTTVVDDSAADFIRGDEGRDWFLRPFEGHLDRDVLSDRIRNEAFNAVIPIARSEVRPEGNSVAALEELVPDSDATHVAIASGNWSDENVWREGLVPTDGARVLISAGLKLTVDARLAVRLHSIGVRGTLNFAEDRSTRLIAETIAVFPNGLFEIGTEESPIRDDVTAELVIADLGPVDRSQDVFALGRGLIVASQLRMYGATKTAFTTLLGGVGVGTAKLRMSNGVPADWRVGDQLVLAGTSSNAAEDERLTLLGIDGDAVVVRPLAFAHLLPETTNPLDRPLRIHLANLTRNVVVKSENAQLDRRGYVSVLGTDDVQIKFSAFLELGRTTKLVPVNDVLFDDAGRVISGTGTNPRGRYALSFERAGVIRDGRAAFVRGSVVSGSPGWGFVNHSSEVNFIDNVSYDVSGAGFVAEAGNEIGSFIGNLAIRGHGTAAGYNDRYDLSDFGHQGDGFWIQSPGVTVEGNAASGMRGNGLILYSRGIAEWDKQDDRLPLDQSTPFLASNLEDPEIAAGGDMVVVYDVPVRHFNNNEAYGSTTGITIDDIYYRHFTDFDRVPHAIRSSISNLTTWSSSIGLHIGHVHRTDFSGLVAIGRTTRPTGYGIRAHLSGSSLTFRDSYVEGFLYGLTVPRRGVNRIDGGYFNNIDSITNLSIQQTLAVGTPAEVRGLDNTIRGVSFGTISSTALRGTVQRNVVLTSWNRPNQNSYVNVFEPMSVTLDFGSFVNRRVYFALQAENAVIFPDPLEDLDSQWVGKTNAELMALFGLTFGGAMTPANAMLVDGVFADIGPLTDRVSRIATSSPAQGE